MVEVYVAPSRDGVVRLMATRRNWQQVQRALDSRLAGMVALALQDRSAVVYVEASVADAREIMRVANSLGVR